MGASSGFVDPSTITGPVSTAKVTPTQLIAELNRFADPAAGAAQLFPDTLPNVLSDTAAGRASAIVVKRAIEDGDVTAATMAGSAAAFGGLAPTAWLQKNLDLVTQIVTGYADAHGLPPASIDQSSIPTTAIVAAAAVAAYFLFFRKKRRR